MLTPVTTGLHHQAQACAGIKPRSSCILGKHPTNCGNGSLKMTFSSFSLNSASTANKVLSGSKGRDFRHFWKVIATLNTGIMLPSACAFLNACLLHIKLFFISVGIWILSALEIGVIKKKHWQKSQSFSKEISQLYVFDYFLDLAVTHSGVYVNTKGC